MTLREKVVVLTGASSGIGRAAALGFSRAGARLVLAARRAEVLHELAAECSRLGGAAIAVPTDVTDAAQVESLAERAVAAFGAIDVWVNDAGVYLLGPVEETPIEIHRRVVETNLLGVIYGSRAAIARFRPRGAGVLINVASAAGRGPYLFAATYAATKLGVRGFSRGLRQELLGTGIDACVISPGAVDTPLFEHAANYTGRALRAMEPVIDPVTVARAIIRCARRPRREVSVGSAPRLLGLLDRIAPSLYERLAARAVRGRHLERRTALWSTGNLLAPAGSSQLRGGFGGVGLRAIALPAACTALLVGLGLAARRRLLAA